LRPRRPGYEGSRELFGGYDQQHGPTAGATH
jgi:hypothetical protein